MSGSLLQAFNVFESHANVDKEYKAVGHKLCNAIGTQDQLLSCMVTILSAQQEISLACNETLQMAEELRQLASQQNKTWRGGKELEKCVKQIAYQYILKGDVQAYTAKENKEGIQEELPHSLYAKVLLSGVLVYRLINLTVNLLNKVSKQDSFSSQGLEGQCLHVKDTIQKPGHPVHCTH
ncbi:hypothetical protein DFH28DRAFT_286315 [Melampsora americana]|nr:hypothetical protein DFH28DRAFT_286315 [Melampsora americana]